MPVDRGWLGLDADKNPQSTGNESGKGDWNKNLAISGSFKVTVA
jgi:hypothetical protein